MRIDFYLHLLACLSIFLIAYEFFNLRAAIVLTIWIGIGKELYDWSVKGTDMDLIDWIGDTCGIIIGLLVVALKYAIK